VVDGGCLSSAPLRTRPPPFVDEVGTNALVHALYLTVSCFACGFRQDLHCFPSSLPRLLLPARGGRNDAWQLIGCTNSLFNHPSTSSNQEENPNFSLTTRPKQTGP